jgi:hypothetical protein
LDFVVALLNLVELGQQNVFSFRHNHKRGSLKAKIAHPASQETLLSPKTQLSLLVFFFALFYVACAVLLLESLYSAGSIDILLLARIEGMAHRANLGVDFFGGTTGLERVAAAAVNHYLVVFWMYSFFHNFNSTK